MCRIERIHGQEYANWAEIDVRGNRILVAICSFNIVLFVLVKFYYIKRNERRQRAWNDMTGDEKVDYVYNTKDEGTKRLDFRFAH